MKAFRKTSFSVYLPDGSRCRGTFYPGSSRMVGVHVHGFRSSMSHTKAQFFVEHALERGYNWANFDLPCHGSSEGKFRQFRVSTALTALIEVIHQFREAPIMLLGSSLGAWLSILAARRLVKSANVTIASAVLVAPAFDFFKYHLKDESAETLRLWRRNRVRRFTDSDDQQPYELDYAIVEDAARHHILGNPSTYDFPIRIFHGDQDEIVPLELSEQFKTMSTESDIKLNVIKGGDHSLNSHMPLVANAIDTMFKKS